jgi:hypothetical protein
MILATQALISGSCRRFATDSLTHLAGVSGLFRAERLFSQVSIGVCRAALYYLTQRVGA